MEQVSRPGAGAAGARRQDAPVRRQLTRALSIVLVPLALLTVANLYALQRTLRSFDHAVVRAHAAVPFSKLRAALAAVEPPAYDVLVAARPDAKELLTAVLDDVDPLFESVLHSDDLRRDEKALVATAWSEWGRAATLASAAMTIPLEAAERRAVLAAEFSTHVRAAIAALADAERRALEDADAAISEAKRLQRVTSLLALLGFVVALAGAAVAVRRVSTSLLHPIQRLHQGALRLGAGDLSHRVALDRSDELGELGEAFDLMAERLEENRRQLAHQALHDSLTGLANRALLLDRAEHAITRLARAGGAVALVVVDLDEFKTVNDSLGHAAGDEVLRRTARRIERFVRPSDTVARLGGDEFAVLLEDVRSDAEALAPADRLLAVITEPIAIGGRDIALSGSIGVAVSWGAEEAEDVLRNADLAMYRSKYGGKNRWTLFEDHMHSEMVERLLLEAQVRRANERDEFVLHYQPIVDLRTGSVRGVEALVRWQHPERGLLGPHHFIGLAEDTGLIVPIGQWVLESACYQLASWRERHPELANLTVNVNVSVRQLHDPTLVEQVATALRQAVLPADALTVEITETVMMEDAELARSRLAELKQLGVRIAVDDFGTGYSSLGYLQSFEIDVLKIDRSFVDGVESSAERRAMLDAILGLARALRLTTVAEGIEEPAQHEAMLTLGCTLGQGYVFARPLGPAQIEAVLLTAAASAGGLAGGGSTVVLP
jgi:diguanylate cyclase (GGDEF)-like protein